MATGAEALSKSPDAFRTISEVATFLDTPAHVLRFWESKFPQIKPVKRAGGRRYYRPDDIALLSGIKALLHDQGMTIRGVQKLLKERGARHVATLSAMPWEGEDEAAPEEAVIVGPWPRAAEDEPAESEAPRGIPSPLGDFVAGTLDRMSASSGPATLAGLRDALGRADPARVRDLAPDLGPLVARLAAVRDRMAPDRR